MPTHDIRPRVIAAVSNLQVFTVAQLCEAAGLQKRDQADAQIARLSKEGYLERNRLPAGGRRHRPLTQYRVTGDPVRREQLAKEVLRYVPVSRQTDEAVGSEVLQQANTSLDELEQRFDQIQVTKDPSAGLDQLSGLGDELENVRANVEAALMEYGAAINAESTPDHPAILARNRWSAATNRRRKIEKDLKSRRMANTASRVLTTAAGIIARAAIAWPAGQIAEAIFKQLAASQKMEPAMVERLLDEMSDARSLNDVLGRFFYSACNATQDSRVLSDILKVLSGLNAPWLVFNEENTRLLAHSKIDWGRWLWGYQELERKIDIRPRPGALGVYACLSNEFTRDAYLNLTRQNRLSVISRHTIDFLGASQPILPVLLFAHRDHWQPFECSYLGGERTLYAYGPLAQDVLEVPGAPPARVAACLGQWGVQLDVTNLKRIAQPLEADRTLIVMQNRELKDPHELTRQIIEVIPEVKEIAVKL